MLFFGDHSTAEDLQNQLSACPDSIVTEPGSSLT
jgi:hypothetical protein